MSLYYCVSGPWGETQLTQSPHSLSLSLAIGSGGGVSFCKGKESFSVGCGFLIASLSWKEGMFWTSVQGRSGSSSLSEL